MYESKKLPEVPERRPLEKQVRAYGPQAVTKQSSTEGVQQKTTPAQTTPQPGKAQPVVKKKLWYCKQCGYVVFREDPPYVCPICKAKKELFAEIDNKIEFSG